MKKTISHLSVAHSQFIGHLRGLLSRIIYFLLGESLAVCPSVFNDRRVIVIGPAKTVVEELEGIDLNDFDIIVRMNRAIDVPLTQNGEIWRVDVLFHNLIESGDRGAGRITREKIQRCDTKAIVFPGGGPSKALLIVEAKLKMLFRGVKAKVGMIPAGLYSHVRNSISGYSPTTGVIALAYFLECNYRTLNIIGFTFFQTKYMNNYNDDLANDADGYAWAQRRNIHNPKLEAKFIKSVINVHLKMGRKLFIGEHVTKSLASVDQVCAWP